MNEQPLHPQRLTEMLEEISQSLLQNEVVQETIKNENPLLLTSVVQQAMLVELQKKNPNWDLLLQNLMVLHHCIDYHGLSDTQTEENNALHDNSD